MQSTWLADVPGGKKWDEERVTKTTFKIIFEIKIFK